MPPVVTKKVTPVVVFSTKLSTKLIADDVPDTFSSPLRLAVSLVTRYFMFTANSLARSNVIPVAVNVDVLSVNVAFANALSWIPEPCIGACVPTSLLVK